MTQSSDDQKNRRDAVQKLQTSSVEIAIEIPSLCPSNDRPEKDEGRNTNDEGIRESLIQNPSSSRKRQASSFLKRFLLTLLLLNLVPNSTVNALALNINSPVEARNEAPHSQAALHQFYFRNANTNTNATQKEQPVVISSSSDNSNSNNNSDSQVDVDAEPKSNFSHAKTNASANVNASPFSNVNSAENTIPHEHDEKHAGVKKEAQRQPQLSNFSSSALAWNGNRTGVSDGSGSKPVCEKNGTSGYQHSVEDILRQIFGADGLDEDENDEEEDDAEFMNEHYHDRDDRYEFERSTFNGTTAVVHHARYTRDIDSRRGPLQVDDADDESAQSSAEEEEEEAQLRPQPQPRPPAPKPKKTPLAQGNGNGNKNRMNPPKNQQQQKQQVRQPNQSKRKQQAQKKPPKPPVNPAEKRAEMLAKYNAYVDAVFSRMNVLVKKKRMDPLRVNLYAGPSKPAGGGNGNGGSSSGNGGGGSAGGVAKKNGKRKASLAAKNKNKSSRMEDDDDSNSDDHDEFGVGVGVSPSEEDDDESSGASSADEERAFRGSSAVHDVHLDSNVFGRSIRSLLANISQYSHAVLSNPSLSSEQRFGDDAGADSHGELEAETVEEGRGNVNGKAPGNKKNIKNRNGGVKNQSSDSNISEKFLHKHRNKNKFNKNKNKNRNAPRPTRGILHGLSSLRRDGNVQVVKDGPKARIVRAKFLLGPVALEILPKKGKPNRGQSRENNENNVNASTSRQNPSPAGSAPADTSSGDGGKANSGEGADSSSTDGTSTATAPAATATAPQLRGILEIRLAPNRPTRIRKLRVFPPGNVQVEGDKATTNAGGSASKTGSGYRKVTPQATARLRQTALQVVRQVDRRLRPAENGNGKKKPGQRQRIEVEADE